MEGAVTEREMFGECDGRSGVFSLRLSQLGGGHGSCSLQRDQLHGDPHRASRVQVQGVRPLLRLLGESLALSGRI